MADSVPGRGSNGHPSHALVWYVGGLALLGGAIGYLVGASRSPVVVAALPLLFGLVTGAGGLFLVKADLTAKATHRRLQLYGRTLIAFVLLLMVGIFAGISLRTGIGLSSMFTGLWSGFNETAISTAQLPPLDAVRMIMLRRNLQAVGASNEEQIVILKAAQTGTVTTLERAHATAVLTEIAAVAGKLGKSIKPLVPQPLKLADGTASIQMEDQLEADLVNGIRSLSLSLAREAGYFSRRIADTKRDVPLQQLASRIEFFSSQISNSITSQGIDGWLLENADLSDSIYDLQLQLLSFKGELNTSILSVADQANEQINAFLGARADVVLPEPMVESRAVACLMC